MEFIKKQSVSTWITLGALIMALIGAILYGVNVGAVGYYHDVTIDYACCIVSACAI